MVVSNQNITDSAQTAGGWGRIVDFLHQRLVLPTSQSLRVLVRQITGIVTPRATNQLNDSIIRYIPVSSWRPDDVLERSNLLFRRENQGESFDDDVSALRDQVSSGRRDQSDDTYPSEAEQTSYSPPRQSWNSVSGAQSTPSYGSAANEAPKRDVPESSDASVIAHNTTWDGTVHANGPLHVYGTLGGQITAEGDVYVAEGASVSATIRAGSMTIAGSIEGSIECTGRFEVLPSGRVTADVAAPRLVVHEGAVVVGKLRMTSQDSTGV